MVKKIFSKIMYLPLVILGYRKKTIQLTCVHNCRFMYKSHFVFATVIVLFGCNKDQLQNGNSDYFSEVDKKNFDLGFTSWPYAPTIESVDNTYNFIAENSDIYCEHIDNNIPWNSWTNDLPLPIEFINDITARQSRKIPNTKLVVSVSVLNFDRNDLALDYDGQIPNYTSMNDVHIEDAYFKHIKYIVNQLNPNYLVISIEVNELFKNTPSKWDEYKRLMANVKTRIQQESPSLRISESMTLHNLYEPDVPNPQAYIDELVDYANTMDFVSISFYPYFKGLQTNEEFQHAFDFLHDNINQPIAFAETGHLSEDLVIDSLGISIQGNEKEQNNYAEKLLENAQEENYEFVIWWTHRDYNELWETFPLELQDLGKIWISTGLINEDGNEKEAYSTWQIVLDK
jgi:hypothetical protein